MAEQYFPFPPLSKTIAGEIQCNFRIKVSLHSRHKNHQKLACRQSFTSLTSSPETAYIVCDKSSPFSSYAWKSHILMMDPHKDVETDYQPALELTVYII